MRFSPVAQITAANVSQLKAAWVYHMKPTPAAAPASAGEAVAAPAQGRGGRGRGGSGFAAGQTTPLVVNGVMYISTPYGRVVAIDPTTGQEVWVFQVATGSPSTRGVEYWPGDAQTPPQIVFGTSDAKLFSLDAKTGIPNGAFGDKGIVDVNTPEILQGLPGVNGMSSPPIVYRHLIITGGRTQENHRRDPRGRTRLGHPTGKLVGRPVGAACGGKVQRHWAGTAGRPFGREVWASSPWMPSVASWYMPFGAPSVDSTWRPPRRHLFSTTLSPRREHWKVFVALQWCTRYRGADLAARRAHRRPGVAERFRRSGDRQSPAPVPADRVNGKRSTASKSGPASSEVPLERHGKRSRPVKPARSRA